MSERAAFIVMIVAGSVGLFVLYGILGVFA